MYSVVLLISIIFARFLADCDRSISRPAAFSSSCKEKKINNEKLCDCRLTVKTVKAVKTVTAVHMEVRESRGER